MPHTFHPPIQRTHAPVELHQVQALDVEAVEAPLHDGPHVGGVDPGEHGQVGDEFGVHLCVCWWMVVCVGGGGICILYIYRDTPIYICVCVTNLHGLGVDGGGAVVSQEAPDEALHLFFIL